MTTRPLTDEHLAEIRARIAAAIAQHRNPDMHGLSNGDFVVMPDEYQACYDLADAVMPEVEKLRAELASAEAERDTLANNADMLAVSTMGEAFERIEQIKAEQETLRGVAQALRITVEEMLSGKQHTLARTMVWQSTLMYATEALTATPTPAPPPAASADLRMPPRELKMLRETLCRTQSQLPDAHDKQRIQALIAEIDRHRPLGPDGTHSGRHTPTCGCEDPGELTDDYQPPCGNPDCREWHCGNCEQHSGQFGHFVRGLWRCGGNSTGEQDGE